MQYRRDIDGLRAIAVVPVVLFHIAQSTMRGGYVGVDVFFVISGYLISRNILSEALQGHFRLSTFWARRFRRIVPAYAVMMLTVSLLVVWRYFPDDAEVYGRTLIASILSISNIYFWWVINYFNPAGETLPLLHTWSLALEEQFYLLFPLLVLAVLRWAPRRLMAVVVSAFLASLTLCIALMFLFPTFGFYWIFARAWELLLGTMLALERTPGLHRRWQRETIGLAGIAMMASAMLLYTPYLPYPGYYALLPCVGAAMVIHSGSQGDTLVARMLSLRPVTFVGLISYSLYLWHWPLIALQKADWLLVATSSKLVERSVVLIASFLAATLSWWLIERPTRHSGRFSMRTLLVTFGAALVTLLIMAMALVEGKGLPGRFPQRANQLAAYSAYDFKRSMRVGRCLLSETMPVAQFDQRACLPIAPARRSYLLIGDSHAGALSSGMIAAYHDVNVLQVTASGCLPTLDPQPLAPATACEALMRFGLLELPQQRRIDGIWMFARLGVGTIADNVASVVRTAARLQAAGHTVTLIGPNPEYRVGLPRLLAKGAMQHQPDLPERFRSPEPMVADALLKAEATRHGIRYVSFARRICSSQQCRTMADGGVPMLFDTDHLTREGGQLAAERLRDDLLGQTR